MAGGTNAPPDREAPPGADTVPVRVVPAHAIPAGAASPAGVPLEAIEPIKPIEPMTPTEPAAPVWANWPDEQLLDLRLCELALSIDHGALPERIDELSRELAARHITFRPHFWLSDEWFTPDEVGGIAIPFYLAHPRLMRLEQSQMLEVEGGTPESCLRILRHEAGHAIDNAFKLRRRRRRQQLFGRSSTPYPDEYTPKPYSRSHVLYLDSWYAQSHPDEDFAETFAVWLDDRTLWRQRYSDWPALKKLEYMDHMMRTLANRDPGRVSRRKVHPLSRQRRTLRAHYQAKRDRWGLTRPNVYDRELRRLFSDAPEFAGNLSAARFLSRIRKPVRRRVARWTGAYQYTIDQVLQDIITRCRVLNLRLAVSPEVAQPDFTVLLTVQTMNYLHSGRHRVAL